MNRDDKISIHPDLKKLKEMPVIIKHAKSLIISGYMTNMKGRIMARKCRLYADSLENVGSYQTFRVKALDAIKDFSHWLHERNEYIGQLSRY